MAETSKPGEFELVAKLRDRLASTVSGRAAAADIVAGSGDDASITIPEGATATSVDLAIEGVHFRRSTASPHAIGHKALAAALSDLAAMGAAPGEAYVQLGLPDDLSEAECLELADGLGAVAAASGIEVLGGDLSRSPVLVVAVTVVGHAPAPEALVTRAGAAEGEEVCVTGELGAAAAGLILLERPELAAGVPAELAEALRRRQLSPVPRLGAGRALAEAGAGAMIDISDGIGADAGHLARASGVRLELDAERIPLALGVSELAAAAELDPVELAASGGEDYELLVTLGTDAVAAATAALAAQGIALTTIGRSAPGEGLSLRLGSGGELDAGGFDQLRAGLPVPPRSDPSTAA